MQFGFFALPFGVIELILIGIVIVLVLKAITKDNRGAKTIAVVLTVVGALLIVPILLLALLFGVRSATYTEVQNQEAHAAAVAATKQAMLETQRIRLETEQMAAVVRAKADEIRQKTTIQVESPTDVPTPAESAATVRSSELQAPDQPLVVEEPATTSAAPQAQTVSAATAVDHSGVLVAGDPWSSAVEEHQDFEADVYPSIEAAAEALGRRVGQQLIQNAKSQEPEQPYVYVWRDDNGVDATFITREVMEAAARGLKQKLIDPTRVSVERPVDGVAVRLALQEVRYENHNRWRRQTESIAGGLAIRVQAADESFALSTQFVDTPWLVDRTGFARNYSNGDWLIAYSDGTHSTQDEARWDAISKAADTVLPLAQARISRMSGSDQQRFQQELAKNPNWLRDRIMDELVSRNLAADQFTQHFDRPYGPVWREAVLVDATPDRIDAIARSLVQGINVKVTHQRVTWFSYIALGLLVVGTYLFLNMATKGYYAWSLRLALIAGLAVVVFLFLKIA